MIRKHSLTIRGHRTSISIEDAFWTVLEEIAESRQLPMAALIAEIDEARPADANLSSALRVHVLEQVIGRSETHRADGI